MRAAGINGADRLDGGPENDVITVGDNDYIHGYDGEDRLNSGLHNDHIGRGTRPIT